MGLGIYDRLTVEKRSHPSNPDAWLINGIAGRETATGRRVDEDSALSSTAVWAAVRILASTMATVPLHLFRQEGRSKTVDRAHPTDEVVYRRPNPELSATEFREMIVGNCVISHNGFAEIVWRDGYPAELWPLWNHRVKPFRNGGRLLYRITVPSGPDVILPRQNVLHLRGFSNGGLLGLSPVETNQEAIALSQAVEEYGARFYANGATPSGVVKHPARLSMEAQGRLRDSMESHHRGLSRSHRLMILEEGMEWQQQGVNPQDAQAIESRKFQLTEVARIFNVQPHLLKDLERATFTNIEHQGMEFVRYSIRDWAVRIEQRMELSLLTEGDRAAGYILRHNLEGLLRGDIKSRYEAYAIGRQNSLLSSNDCRELEDLNPIPAELGGDDYHIQLNMMRLDQAGMEPEEVSSEGPPPGGEEEGGRQARSLEVRQKNAARFRHRQQLAYRQVIEDTANRVIGREVKLVRKGFLGAFKKRKAEDVRQWLKETYEAESVFVAEAFLGAFRAFADLVVGAVSSETGMERDIGPELDAFVGEYATTFGARWAAISRNQLETILRDTKPEELEAVLDETLDDWTDKRAAKLAHDESTQANNAFAVLAYGLFGIGILRWATMGDSCPFCARMNGKTVGISGHFLEAGTVINGGEGVAPMTTKQKLRHPPLHSGCDCQVVAG